MAVENNLIEKKVYYKEFILNTDFFFFKPWRKKEVSGIYLLIFPNEKFYIGSSVNIKDRITQHFSHFRREVHSNIYMQRCYNKYGYPIILYKPVNKKSILSTEQFFIDRNIQHKNCLNICTNVKLPNINSKIIYQYDLKGRFIKEWKSITEAAVSLNLTASHISEAASGKRHKTCGGYVWKYIKESKSIAVSRKYPKYENLIIYKIDKKTYSLVDKLYLKDIENVVKRNNIRKKIDTNLSAYGHYWKTRINGIQLDKN